MLKGKINILIKYSLSVAYIAKELQEELINMAGGDGRVVVYKTNSPRPISVKHIQGLLTKKICIDYVTQYQGIDNSDENEDHAITAYHHLNMKTLYKLKLISKAVLDDNLED